MLIPGRLIFVIFASQTISILFYGLFVEFPEGVKASTMAENEEETTLY
jgi:hypothetical protein